MAKDLDWKPIRKGAIYCSSACGNNCTYADYAKAHRAVSRLLLQLGPGFKAGVWENLGWHYKAVSIRGEIDISKSTGSGGWVAYAAGAANFGKTPRSALAALRKELADRVEEARAGAYLVTRALEDVMVHQSRKRTHA